MTDVSLHHIGAGNEDLSRHMIALKKAVDAFDEVRYSEILTHDIFDSDEVLMLAYCAVVCFNSQQAFDILMKRNNHFKLKPEWHAVFAAPKVFMTLQINSPERRKLDLLTIKTAFERDLNFMVDLVLE